jgi:hypothetical protein
MVKKPRRPFDPFSELDRLQKDWWILDEQHIPHAVDVRSWAEWYEAAARKGQADGMPFDPRRVALTETATMRVSTVFLGANHQWGKGPPILFETMVFTLDQFPREFEGKIRFSPDDFDTFRYSSWDDAEAGHRATVRRIEKAEADALAAIKLKEGKKHGS